MIPQKLLINLLQMISFTKCFKNKISKTLSLCKVQFQTATKLFKFGNTIQINVYQSIKMSASSNLKLSRLINPYFLAVSLFIIFNYVVFVYEFMISRNPAGKVLMLFVFHLIFLMLLWSMFRSILSDPGKVPIYWGFFAQESDNRKRRYCLLCHSFKPQRCHHCSTCQRCVLNMDHHCPWISNCVGFANRKFFMLFLLYIILTLVFSVSCELFVISKEALNIIDGDEKINVHTCIRILGLLAQISFFFPVAMFFKFHVELVLENSSTLDNLQKQRNPNAGANMYNIGAYQNFLQVFGSTKYLWLVPIIDAQQKANGVTWPKNQ